MLRTIMYKKTAWLGAVGVIVLFLLATVYPMRLYTQEYVVYSSLEPSSVSGEVTQEYDAGEYFVAQYDHLETLEFYVNSVITEGEAEFQLFHVGENLAMELIAEETLTLPDEAPGYLSVPADADLEVGETYVFTVRGLENSRFTVSYEAQDEALSEENSPLYQVGFYNDTSIENAALKLRLTYVVPLPFLFSLRLICFYLLLGVVAVILICHYFKKRKEKNTLVTLHRTLQLTLTPVILIVGGLAIIAVWPLKLFDSRILDILIYEAGIILAILVGLYALWHDRTGISDWVNQETIGKNVWHYAIIICIALIMDASADYMNATVELSHNIAMHRIVILLCLITLFMGDIASNFSNATLTASFIACIGAIVYAVSCHVPSSEEDASLLNGVTTSRAVAVAVAVIAVTSTVVMLLKNHRKNIKPQTYVQKQVGIPVLILSVMLLVFRNTRLWIPLLLGIWAMFYVRYCFWKGRERFLQNLCEGILLDFGCKVIYCMLHRYYLAYHYSRFSMHFHTPTVTAYYLLIVCCAALVMFLYQWKKTQTIHGKEKFRLIWKEIFMLGLAGSYMMMNLSRSGIGAFAILIVLSCVLAVLGLGKEKGILKVKKGLTCFGTILLSILMVFPIAFSGQRLISTVYAHPHRFEELETYDDWIMRNVTWNCTRFMNIEIFIRDFGDRILGGDVGSKLYYGLEWNEPQGYRTSMAPSLFGEDTWLYEEKCEVAMEGEEGSQRILSLVLQEDSSLEANSALLLTSDTDLSSGSLETGDLSNGRIGLYLVYLENLNLVGHEEMGVVLPSGETAVHAHNVFIQTAYDCGIPTGIVFTVVLVLLFVFSLRFWMREKDKNRCAMMPALLLGGFLVIGMVEWIFHFSNPFTIVVLFGIAPILFPGKDET